MKKILLLMLIMFMGISIIYTPSIYLSAENELPSQVKVVANSTYIYSGPDSTSSIIATCNYGTVLDLKQNTLVDYLQFYEIETINIVTGATADSVGYVLKAHTLDNSISSPQRYLQPNATIKNNNSTIYLKNNQEYTQTLITLNQGSKVQILDGYDKNKEYTKISFTQDEQIVTYYIKTIDLEVKGINYSVIVGVMTLVTVVCALSIVLGLKQKKKKKI